MTTAPTEPPNKKIADSPPLTDRFGIVVPSALPLLDEREVLLMRLLGRLDMMALPQLMQAVYPTYSGRGVQNRLDHLLHNDLLWRVQTRTVAANHAAEYTRVRKQGAYAYGLSDQGKELLNTLEVERDPLTLERLRSRDARIARDAVVHRDDQRGLAARGERDDLRCQAIAELEAVRHEEIHRSESP